MLRQKVYFQEAKGWTGQVFSIVNTILLLSVVALQRGYVIKTVYLLLGGIIFVVAHCTVGYYLLNHAGLRQTEIQINQQYDPSYINMMEVLKNVENRLNINESRKEDH